MATIDEIVQTLIQGTTKREIDWTRDDPTHFSIELGDARGRVYRDLKGNHRFQILNTSNEVVESKVEPANTTPGNVFVLYQAARRQALKAEETLSDVQEFLKKKVK